jgi:hypothetical protein
MKGLQPGCPSTDNKETLTMMPLSKSQGDPADKHQYRRNSREGTIFQRINSETVFSIVTGP